MNETPDEELPVMQAYDRLWVALSSMRTVHGDEMDQDDASEFFEALCCYIEAEIEDRLSRPPLTIKKGRKDE